MGSTKLKNSIDISNGYSVKAGESIDDRLLFVTVTDLLDFLVGGGLGALYEGMITYVEETGLYYKWTESVFGIMNDENGHASEYAREPFTYAPGWADVAGITYANRTFNFVIVSDSIVFKDVTVQNTQDPPLDMSGPVATEVDIQIHYNYLPLSIYTNKLVNVTMQEYGLLDIEYPAAFVWGGDSLTIRVNPMYAIGTVIHLKLS